MRKIFLTFIVLLALTGYVYGDTKVVDVDGSGDYTSLNSWESNEQADITATGVEIANCKCTGGTADTTIVDIDGWTTDASNYIQIWTDTGDVYRHDGTWSTGNKYRLEYTMTADTQTALKIREDYVRLDGLQIAFSNADYDSAKAIEYPNVIGASNDIRISNTIIVGVGLTGSGDNCDGIYLADADADLTVWNTLVYDIVNANVSCDGIEVFAGDIDLYNVTVADCRRNINAAAGSGVCNAYNTVSYGATQSGTNWMGTWDAGTNDATEGTDADMPQTDKVESVASTDFLDYSNDDFHLASGSALIDQGVTDPGSGLYSDDIDGETRSTWDIGIDEILSAFIPTMQMF